MSESTSTSWYSVRCLFQWRGPGKKKRRVYEERITLWRAASFEEAIAKAEAEAIEYLADEDEPTRRRSGTCHWLRRTE